MFSSQDTVLEINLSHFQHLKQTHILALMISLFVFLCFLQLIWSIQQPLFLSLNVGVTSRRAQEVCKLYIPYGEILPLLTSRSTQQTEKKIGIKVFFILVMKWYNPCLPQTHLGSHMCQLHLLISRKMHIRVKWTFHQVVQI